MDFPGQGTALVGMLNLIMESKGVIDPKEWRGFCGATVPLFRMEKYAWTTDETLRGEVQIAHYGPKNLDHALVTATVSNSLGKQVAAHSFPANNLHAGGLRSVVTYQLPLNTTGIKDAELLTLTLAIEGTPYRNRYPVWVYPPKVDTSIPKDVMVASSFAAAKTRDHLAAGGKVLLLPKPDKLPRSVPGGFQCEFWSPMFAEAAIKRGEKLLPPGTLGLICDPKSPALARFPTEFHSNWQWWHSVKTSRPITYDGSPDNYRPTAQVIDNFLRNHKLGLIAETRVGKGSMVICAIDLLVLQDKPEARQMLHSLLHYMDSPDFAPEHELDEALLNKLLAE